MGSSAACELQGWTLVPRLRGGGINPKAESLDPKAKAPSLEAQGAQEGQLGPAKWERSKSFKEWMVLSNMAATCGSSHLHLG